MSLSIIYTRAELSLQAPLVTVETHLSKGMPALSIVGLPETAVRESKDRVRSAILNAGFEFPISRITVNLAPADLPKEGGRFDLSIAMGILIASGQIFSSEIAHYEFAGELALSGELRGVKGILPFALHTKQVNRTLILPLENAEEAALIEGVTILPAQHINDVCAHLTGKKLLPPHNRKLTEQTVSYDIDLSDIRDQQHAKRALEIAAAGGHSILFIGPPGTGKTMLASRLPTVLPAMTEAESIESAIINSISQRGFDSRDWGKRPYRSPHHSASSVALVGGGNPPKPGEVSLAHQGILFLDELPEFDRKVLETLREPLESGKITISRAAKQSEFPARFQLIAAMNPCPCGFLGDVEGQCKCSPRQIQRYRSKISGPFLDRIDMHVEVPRLPPYVLSMQHHLAESSEVVKKRVEMARDRQKMRYNKCNAVLGTKQIEKSCRLGQAERNLLEKIMKKFKLSGRSYHRLLKVALTIADLYSVDRVTISHISEALSFRRLDALQVKQEGEGN